MSDGAGAQDVLDDLIKQFADPLACLRELIQNAVDAGSDVVEVRAFRDGEYGVLEIQDHGEGMTKEIIENKLVRLFASSKDGDLTKIGKFGIGFVSVFALDPVVVCVDTARAGERWRVIFHRDRTWTRAALDEPMEGTRVRLYLERDPAAFGQLVREADRAVKKWCRFLQAEVLFDGNAINEPLALPQCFLTERHDDGAGTTVVVGIGGEVQVGFYNKGLTLLESPSWPDVPAGVSVLLSSRWLEHTLTRDSVVKDTNYEKAIAQARELIDARLEPACRATCANASPEQRSVLWAWLATRADRELRKDPFIVDVKGQRHAPSALTQRPPWIVRGGSPSSQRVAEAVAATGSIVVAVNPGHVDGDRDSLAALLGCKTSQLVDVESAFVAIEPVEPARAARAARLAEQTARLLSESGESRVVLLARVIGERCRSQLAWMAPADFAVRQDAPVALSVVPPPAGLLRRTPSLVVDVDHGELQSILALAQTQTALAAMLLVRLALMGSLSDEINEALTMSTWTLHRVSETEAVKQEDR